MIVKKLHILILSFLIIIPSLSFGENAPARLKDHAASVFNPSARIAREGAERANREALAAERKMLADQAAERQRINDLRIQENFNKAAELKKVREIKQANKIAQENKDHITKEVVEKRRQIDSIKEQERRNLAKQNEVRQQQKIQQEAELKRQAAEKILQTNNARAPVSIQKSPGGLLTQRDQITRGVDKLTPQQRDKTLAVAKEIENKAAALKAKDNLVTTKQGLGGNPFKGRTPQQIDDAFRKKGFDLKGSNPIAGKGSYINPKTKRKYYIDKGGEYKKGTELPHVDVHRPPASFLPKKKFPLGDQLTK